MTIDLPTGSAPGKYRRPALAKTHAADGVEVLVLVALDVVGIKEQVGKVVATQ